MEEAFNVKIGYDSREVTLTILRAVNYYKVIYFGGVMGGVRFTDGKWELIDPEELEAGDLPLYTPDQKGERLEITLNKDIAEAIGKEIELLKA